VHFTGYLSEADRQAHLAHCTAYVSASLYEGWGLPLFEALSLGRPAIYHPGGAQDEFARSLALAVDCRDPQALSRALETLWLDAQERERLRAALAAGFPRLTRYDLEGALRAALRPLLG
jgi:glycosyltransferase involved in cell wall biosynthesis